MIYFIRKLNNKTMVRKRTKKQVKTSKGKVFKSPNIRKKTNRIT